MASDPTLSFVDTTVLVQALARNESPNKRTAQRLLNKLLDDDSLRTSTQVQQELFVILTTKAVPRCTAAEAMAILDDLSAWPSIVVDEEAIRQAAGVAARENLSFRESLLVVTAAGSGAAVLYTEDLQDGREILGVRVTNPFTRG